MSESGAVDETPPPFFFKDNIYIHRKEKSQLLA